jgi:hypothetical protein
MSSSSNLSYSKESVMRDKPDDWVLSVDQMIFMMQHHNEIEDAFDNIDMQALVDISNLKEYKDVFGDMSFDEAYDRYEDSLKS